MRKLTGDKKYVYVCVVLFVISAVFVIIANFIYHILANGIEKMEV